jgi:L-2-hydroxyglutarate oxidase
VIYDYCVIGGGIVGLATALKLQELQPGCGIVLLEKETALAQHQTGHNSGVIHAGIYYAPDSLKAELCRRGAEATKLFCKEHGIPYEVCGKLVVATNAVEVQRLETLLERSRQNGIEVEKIDAAELRCREPRVSGLAAIFVPSTGIVDYRHVCSTIGGLVRVNGGEIVFDADVATINEKPDRVTISTSQGIWTSKRLVVCAGLQSDRLARMAGLDVKHQIIPFRGEYFRLPAAKNDVVRHLIYPVPDPALPFLGVHLTRMIDGGVTVGPNAVLGFSRENLRRCHVNVRDISEYLRFPGLWRLLAGHLAATATEMRNSFWKFGYLQECRRYCPELELADLLPHPAGIRAQAVMRDGSLVHDFLFLETERMLHVCNAPSPAATSAFPIGEMIARRCIGSARAR